MPEELLPDGTRLTDDYLVWRGREYGVGGMARKTGRVAVSFLGPEPFEEGFMEKRRHAHQKWPTWSRWVPIDEVERAFKVFTRGVWHEAEFALQMWDGVDKVYLEGPLKFLGEQKSFGWWIQFPNIEQIDRDTVAGWVPLSEVTDIREEIKELHW